MRISRKDIDFDGEKIKKCNFYKSKKLFNIYQTEASKK